MKLVALGIILLVLIGLDTWYFAGAFVQLDPAWKGYRVVRYRLNNTNYRLLVADTPKKRAKGLMYVEELRGVHGMIFTFENSSYQSFWNKNTYRDLEVYWIQNDEVVGYDKLPSVKTNGITIIQSPKSVDTVVEILK